MSRLYSLVGLACVGCGSWPQTVDYIEDAGPDLINELPEAIATGDWGGLAAKIGAVIVTGILILTGVRTYQKKTTPPAPPPAV